MSPESLIFTDEYLRVRAVPTQHTSTYIFCHGKGQTGAQWQSLVGPLRKLGHCNHVAFIFPYFDFPEAMNESHILSAASLVRNIVSEEIVKGIPAHRIAVGGISEGFEVSLLATVANSTKIAGTVGISKGLQYSRTIMECKTTTNSETPVLMVFRSTETRERPREGILGQIGQSVGALVYSNTEGQTVSATVFCPEKTLGSSCFNPLQETDTLASFLHKVLPETNKQM
jgi:hypothetical protein